MVPIPTDVKNKVATSRKHTKLTDNHYGTGIPVPDILIKAAFTAFTTSDI